MFILSFKGAIYRQKLSSSIFRVSVNELHISWKNEQFFHKVLVVCLFDCFKGGCWQLRELIVTLLSDKFRLCQYKKANAEAKKRFFCHIISYIPMNIQSIPKLTFYDTDTFRYLFLLHWSLFSSVGEDHYHDVSKVWPVLTINTVNGWYLTVYDKL